MPLVLTRRPGESILILTEFGSVEILFDGTTHGAKNARLVITAPEEIAVARKELCVHAIEQRAFAARERGRRGV